MKKVILCTILLLIGLTGFQSCTTQTNPVVHIIDTLQVTTHDTIHVGDTIIVIDTGDGQYSLNLNYSSIENISFIQRIPQLVHLDISYTNVEDISPLQYTPKIRWLSITSTDIVDISPFSYLDSINFLSMLECPFIEDLTPLCSLTNTLERLEISGCSNVTDITPLQSLHRLKGLVTYGLFSNKAITTIPSIHSLEQLEIRYSSFEALPPMDSLQNLYALSFYYMQEIDDISPLSALHALKILSIGHALKITDFSYISVLDSVTVFSGIC